MDKNLISKKKYSKEFILSKFLIDRQNTILPSDLHKVQSNFPLIYSESTLNSEIIKHFFRIDELKSL